MGLKGKIVRPLKKEPVDSFFEHITKLTKRRLEPKHLKNPFVEGSFQTIPGPAVKAFASKHHGMNEKAIRNLINDMVRELPFVNLGVKEARQVYGRQTAEDIFRTKKIPVVFLEGVDSKGRIYQYPAFGCNSQCVALTAVLRSKGIPAVFIRLNKSGGMLGTQTGEKHSVVLFWLGRKQFIADPFNKDPSMRMVLFTDDMHSRFAEMEAKGLLSVGRDAWDIGINAYEDYHDFKKTKFFQTH